MARPAINLDEKFIRKLASLGCTIEEIAEYFDVSKDVISRRYADIVRKGKLDLTMSLRQTQIKRALNGNVVMLIWLGKQILGQMERASIEIAKIPDEIFLEEAKRRLQLKDMSEKK